MKKIISIIIIALICTGSFCSCKKETKSDAALGKGRVITFDFESNPTTGFKWTWAVANDINNGELKFISEDYISDAKDDGMVGVGGHTKFIFEGAKPGKQNLRFVYERPWEGGESIYDVVYELEIDDNLNISCLSKMKGNIESDKDLTSFPNPSFS